MIRLAWGDGDGVRASREHVTVSATTTNRLSARIVTLSRQCEGDVRTVPVAESDPSAAGPAAARASAQARAALDAARTPEATAVAEETSRSAVS